MYYKGRLCKMFVVNSTALIYILWKVIETFMDSNTRTKISLSYGSSPKELLDHIHPSQLLKAYGGECEAPAQYWPPSFPKGKFREEFVKKHCTEEEFKAELIAHPQVWPSPSVAEEIRSKRHGKCKKGLIPHKTYLTPKGLERRDSFNDIKENAEGKSEGKVPSQISQSPFIFAKLALVSLEPVLSQEHNPLALWCTLVRLNIVDVLYIILLSTHGS
jgi:hypothetical protein